MPRKIFSISIALLWTLLLPAFAFGDGYGFYNWSRSWPTISAPDFLKDLIPVDIIPEIAPEIEFDYDHFTAGYMYVRPTTPEDLIEYRFTCGFDVAVAKFKSSEPELAGYQDLYTEAFDAVGYGLATKFSVGIGLVRTESLRIWIGPAIGVNLNYSMSKKIEKEILNTPLESEPRGITLSLGGGLEIGMNYKINSELSVDMSTGFHYHVLGSYQDVRMKINSEPINDDASFFMGQEPMVFVQIGFCFDLNDV